MSGTDDMVTRTEESLRAAERGLEEIAQSICSVEGSVVSFTYINRAISNVQEAIHNCYRMRKDG